MPFFNIFSSSTSKVGTALGAKKSGDDMRLVMLGLDFAGKSVLLEKLKLGEIITTIPTIGFNVETAEYRNISINTFDIGGSSKLGLLRRHYYNDCKGVIFVVDASDRERIPAAVEELVKLLDGETLLAQAPFLIFVNKQDLVPRGAITSNEFESLLLENESATKKLLQNRKWCVQGCCALTGEGLLDGMKWLGEQQAQVV